MGVSDRLNEPYLLGGAPSGADGAVLPVVIAGRSFLIDTSRQTNQSERFRRTSVQLLNTQQNPEKGESALTPPEVWRRSYESWHHGMGQKFADREDSDKYRYDWSKGINPWNRWEVSLLHSVTRVNATGALSGVQVAGHTAVLLTGGSSLWVTDGALQTTFSIGTVSLIATDGNVVYAYGTDQKIRVIKIVNSGTAITVTVDKTITVPMTETVTMIALANFKLIAATTAGKVYDLTGYLGASPPASLPTPPFSPPVPSKVIAACSGKKAVYLLAVTGDKTTVHALGLIRSTDSGPVDTLTDGGVVAELPDGEVGKAIYSYLGYVAIGTSKGFRFAAVGDGEAGLTYGPLIETPAPVTAFEGQDRFLYYGLSNYRGDTGIGRADLSQFVADLQPAYASDLMSPGNIQAKVSFISTLGTGKMMFGLTDGGVWQEQDTYVSSGEITLSGWTFNVVDPKVGLYVASQTSNGSGGGGNLGVYYDQSTNEVPLGDYQEANQKFSLSGYPFHSMALHARLTPSPDFTSTPKIYSVESRASYVRGKATEWQVPCILHDEIEMDNGTVAGRNVVEDYEHLMSLVESGRQFVYIEDGKQWTVYATEFVWSPQERSQTSGWQGVFTIYFREVR